MTKRVGKRTVEFSSPVYITGFGSAVGSKEARGPLGKLFDFKTNDDFAGKPSYELAETEFMSMAIKYAMERSGLDKSEFELSLGGDLLNQCTATSYCMRELGLAFIGLFNACATMAEGMALASMLIDGGFANNTVSAASSHFCTAERQFRFPLEYGGQRPPSAQWTVTGSGAVTLSNKKGSYPISVKRATVGKIVDLQITDANNMGAAMAPAFFDTLYNYFKDTNTKPDDFDVILSGDLGKIGSDIARDLFLREGIELGESYTDCGLLIYDMNGQDVHSGGSGCGCSATVLCAKILPEMISGRIKRALFIGTGALMSPMMLLQKESIASIAHLVELSCE
ncbi:MAG: stage V sporulation protein AD [Clostridia bacterium]|nr:stage V sporulation protein AD [Clostridia bacterium]